MNRNKNFRNAFDAAGCWWKLRAAGSVLVCGARERASVSPAEMAARESALFRRPITWNARCLERAAAPAAHNVRPLYVKKERKNEKGQKKLHARAFYRLHHHQTPEGAQITRERGATDSVDACSCRFIIIVPGDFRIIRQLEGSWCSRPDSRSVKPVFIEP